jgi:hypothetical protein
MIKRIAAPIGPAFKAFNRRSDRLLRAAKAPRWFETIRPGDD